MAIEYPAPAPYVPRSQRSERGMTRPIACRRCARWSVKVDGAWQHQDDSTPACVDPDQLWADADARRAGQSD